MSQIQVLEISFHHSSSASAGSLPVTLGSQPVAVPEWRSNMTKPEECVAAYAWDCLEEPITIEVKFSCPGLTLGEASIHAIGDSQNFLGDTLNEQVKFDSSGISPLVKFTLPKPRFDKFGVSARSAAWSWEYLTSAGWKQFQVTTHRVFATLNKPTEPWVSESPWVEVLEVACNWADGTKDEVAAASAITDQVYALGSGGPTQNKVIYARTPTYANGNFDCAKFLQLLRNGIGSGETVNCDDCAAIVSTFANILGCDLSQSGMGYDFHTNHICLMGDVKPKKPGFPRHAVAWSGRCEATDFVYDGCFKLDRGGTPKDCQYFVLPKNLPFDGQANTYKGFLFLKGECDPLPQYERRRRPIGPGYLGQRRYTDPSYLDFLKRHYKFDDWQNRNDLSPQNSMVVEAPLRKHPAFLGWEWLECKEFQSHDLNLILKFLLLRTDIEHSHLVELNIYQTKSESTDAFILQLLAQFHQDDVTRLVEPTIGNLSFVEPFNTATLFARSNLIAFIRSVGKEPFATLEMAQAVDEIFLQQLSDTGKGAKNPTEEE